MGIDAQEVRRTAMQAIAHSRGAAPPLDIENQWYAEQPHDSALDVYGTIAYLGELWNCWVNYSRQYLRNIQKPGSMPNGRSVVDDIGEVKRVVDLGCGFGYTTAALTEMFPDAAVFGTIFPGLVQTQLAEEISAEYSFEVVVDVSNVGGAADLVFASEYFEHILDPIHHLDHVLDVLSPRTILTANAFGALSTGHFLKYEMNGGMVHGTAASKPFNDHLRSCGYRKVETRLWNGRPAYWRRFGGGS